MRVDFSLHFACVWMQVRMNVCIACSVRCVRMHSHRCGAQQRLVDLVKAERRWDARERNKDILQGAGQRMADERAAAAARGGFQRIDDDDDDDGAGSGFVFKHVLNPSIEKQLRRS